MKNETAETVTYGPRHQVVGIEFECILSFQYSVLRLKTTHNGYQ